jgi:hypothetical protein
MSLDLRGSLAQQCLNQRGRCDIGLTECPGIEVVTDPCNRMDSDPVGNFRFVTGQGPQPHPQCICQGL